MYVVLVLMFFSMLFWALFEQAGSSINNFTDRNVDRVDEYEVVTAEDIGRTIKIQPTQEQLGYSNGGQLFTLSHLDRLRKENQEADNKEASSEFTIDWVVAEDNIGMGLANRSSELPTSSFQAVNAIFILLFGLVFTALWGFLANRGWEPSTPVKFGLGLVQTWFGLWLCLAERMQS